MSELPFQPSCPLGGKFYVCANAKSKFVGCCGSDPCTSTSSGCSAGDLFPTSFNGSYHGTFADQECSAGLFYTCAKSNPPFLGCCKSNPCAQGSCPTADLASAFLSGDPGKAGSFLPSSSVSAAVSTASSKSQSSSSSVSVASGTSTVLPIHATSSNNGLSTGAIIGVAIGAFAIILGLTGALMFLCGRRAREKKENQRKGTFSLLGQKPEDPAMSTPGLSPAMNSEVFAKEDLRGRYSPYRDSIGSPLPPYYAVPGGPQPSPPFDPRYPALLNTQHSPQMHHGFDGHYQQPVIAELGAINQSPVEVQAVELPTEHHASTVQDAASHKPRGNNQ